MPSQQQLRWSELRVGLTVVFASITLAVLIFLMSGSSGPFAKKLTLQSYFQSTEGLRVGAPVALHGVTIGNVKSIQVVPDHGLTPVLVTMKVSRDYAFKIHKDSIANLATAGVLGELFVDIISKNVKAPTAEDGDVLPSQEANSIDDVLKAGQGTLQNMDVLLKRLDRITATIENGEGSIGKVLNDPALFDRANKLLEQMQLIVNQVGSGKGSIGKLINDDELYDKLNHSIEQLETIIGEVNDGKGSAGKFLKDDSLYRNANETIAKANKLMDDINAGKGTLGKVAKDEEFAKKVDTMVTNLSRLSEKLDKGEGSAGRLFNDPSLYTNADQMLVETRNLVKAVREHPKRYLTIHFKLF
ncbi:MAG: Mammalian cell entry related protein [Candidatus Angelobacter sp.]|jgi:phospholipid/cholesterol/gamma-HCH transport system substrate-binding protein|nr:Mammalian cell entry related protein [Candidatus Angelobacter sp.]